MLALLLAELAEAAAWRAGLGGTEVAAVRRAGLLHDLGRVAIPSGIWDRRGPLRDNEREQVRLHAYYTERVLARSPGLAALGAIAGAPITSGSTARATTAGARRRSFLSPPGCSRPPTATRRCSGRGRRSYRHVVSSPR